MPNLQLMDVDDAGVVTPLAPPLRRDREEIIVVREEHTA
jgi:hypothetical protein